MRFMVVLFCLFFSFTALAKQTLPTRAAAPSVDLEALALQKSYLQTIDCRAPERLTHLLQQSLSNTDNLTDKGNNASVFEEVMMNNPSCFIAALNDLPEKMCQQVAENFIRETFFYPRSEIKQALSSAQNYSNSCIAS